MESVDKLVIIGATSSSKTLSTTGIGLNFLPTSASIACTLSLGNKVLHKININKYSKYKKKLKNIKLLNLAIKYTKNLDKIN